MHRPLIEHARALVIGAVALIGTAGISSAQPMQPSAGPAMLQPSKVIQDVGIDQNLEAQLPLDLVFRDETGKQVKLGDYFVDNDGKPVVLTLVYYECPMLCGMTLNGMAKSFKPLELEIGKDYDVLTVSFDPTEGPELAKAKKANYVEQYGRSGAEQGWHFLTGDQASIDALCKTVGFKYVYDEATQQYAHASVMMVITPQGKISRYFYGLEYSSRDLRLGLVEAGQNKIGTLADAVLLFCYHYDPEKGAYAKDVMNLLRAGGVLTILSLGTFITVMLIRDRRRKASAAQMQVA